MATTEVLLEWGIEHRRPFPWRETRDPWLVMLAEVMLQQTRTDRVADRWPVFVDRFPTPLACADAGQAAVVRAWEGLGYNRRALYLHRAATQIVERFGGEVPSSIEDLMSLPGVGSYTARAIASQCFSIPVCGVDTNVGRVVARLEGRPMERSEVQRVADAFVPEGLEWEWVQTLFDFAAAVCTKREPSCAACPLSAECRWSGRGVDPAGGSWGVSVAQAPFDGSDRQGRGRLIDVLRDGPLADEVSAIANAAGWRDEPERAQRVLRGLAVDGFVERVDGRWHLHG